MALKKHRQSSKAQLAVFASCVQCLPDVVGPGQTEVLVQGLEGGGGPLHQVLVTYPDVPELARREGGK